MKHTIGISILLLLCGCSSLPKLSENARYHQIAANTNGNFLSLFPYQDQHWQCGLNNHLNELVTRMQNHPIDPVTGKRKILISIHGGLNSIAANVKRVEEHYDSALKDGYFPVFISWRSGAATTLYDRYFGVRNGVDRSKWITIPSAPFYFVSDLLSGVAAIPESIWDQGANFYNSHKNNLTGFYEKDINHRLNEFQSPDVYYTQRGAEKSSVEQIGYGIRQIIPGAVRLVSTPLIEGMADKAWGVMRRRAKTLVYRQQDLTYRGIGQSFGDLETMSDDLSETIECENNGQFYESGKPNGVVAQLFRSLRDVTDSEITLVGHSMGAIIANDIVNIYPDLPFSRIIHMASADSIRNFMEKTQPYLVKNSDTQFFNLMLHPLNEEQEQSAFGTAPEGSLLIWIDYLLENPETTLDRVAGRWENMKWVVPLLSSEKNIHLKLFGLRQTMTYEEAPNYMFLEPIKHGDFGDFKFWKSEFYWK